MLLRYIFLFAIFVSNKVSYSQDIETKISGIIKDNKIKTLTIFEYDYIDGKVESKGIKSKIDSFSINGQLVLETFYRNDGSILSTVSYGYDTKGHKTSIIKYSVENSKTKVVYFQKTKFDSKGNKILEYGFNGVDSFKNVYNYNKYGKLVEVNFFIKKRLDEKRVIDIAKDSSLADMKILDGFGSLKYIQRYKYTTTGKIQEETKIENDNTVSQRILYAYDKNDSLISETKFLREKFFYKIIYNYDNKNRISEIYKELPDKTRYMTNRYVYNDNNQLVEEFSRDEKNEDFSRFTYTFDEKGIIKTVDCYFGKYKRQVLSVCMYLYY